MCPRRCSGLAWFWMFLIISATLFGVRIYTVQALEYIKDFTVSPRVVGPGDTVTCSWWIDYDVRYEWHWIVNFTIFYPNGEVVTQSKYIHPGPDGLGSETDPWVETWTVPAIDPISGTYECKVQFYGYLTPTLLEENSDTFGVGVTPPEFNFDLEVAKLSPMQGGIDVTKLLTGEDTQVQEDILEVTITTRRGTPENVVLELGLMSPATGIDVDAIPSSGLPDPDFTSTIRVTASGQPTLGTYDLNITARSISTTKFVMHSLLVYGSPEILDFTPKEGCGNTLVTVTGRCLGGASVDLGDRRVSLQAGTETEATFLVPTNMPSGSYYITVTTPFGTSRSSNQFLVYPCPYVTVTGRIMYEESDGNLKPFRLGKFRLRGLSPNRFLTRSDGTFFVRVPRTNIGQEVYVQIGGSSTSDFNSGFNYAVNIAKDLDRCNEYVWWNSDTKVVPEHADIDFGDLWAGRENDGTLTGYWKEHSVWPFCGGDTHNLYGGSVYFNIADAILTARQYADGMRSENDNIGKVDVEHPDGSEDYSWYSSVWSEIKLHPDDGFDDGTIIHEYAHHLEATISENDWYVGDPEHSFCDDKDDTEFAWSEGFAEYFGTVVVAHHKSPDPLYLSPPDVGYTSMENASLICGSAGADMESTVAGVLWDLVDDPADPVFWDPSSVDPTRRIGSVVEAFDDVANMEEIIFGILDKELDNYVDAPDLCEFIGALRGSRVGLSQAELQEIDDILDHFNVGC